MTPSLKDSFVVVVYLVGVSLYLNINNNNNNLYLFSLIPHLPSSNPINIHLYFVYVNLKENKERLIER